MLLLDDYNGYQMKFEKKRNKEVYLWFSNYTKEYHFLIANAI
jgi:hypothetical protein